MNCSRPRREKEKGLRNGMNFQDNDEGNGIRGIEGIVGNDANKVRWRRFAMVA